MKRILFFAAAALLAGCGGGGSSGTSGGAGNNKLTGDLAFKLASVSPGSGGGSSSEICTYDSILVAFADTCAGGASGQELDISEEFAHGGAPKTGTFNVAPFACDDAGAPTAAATYTAFYSDGGALFLNGTAGTVTIDSIGQGPGGYPTMKGSFQVTLSQDVGSPSHTLSGTFDTTNADGCL